MSRVQELLQERAKLVNDQEQILIAARAENRNPTVDEFEKIKNMDERILEIEKTVDVENAVQSRVNGLDDNYRPVNINEDLNASPPADGGFDSFGDFLQAVARATSPQGGRIRGGGSIDPRLTSLINPQAAATGHSANVPADGGFLITPTRANEILMRTYEGGAVASRCASYEVGENSDTMEVPYVDETSRVNGSRWGGIRCYREGETDTPTATKTKTGLWECRVQDLKALTYVTERELNDAPQLESLLMDLLPQEFTFKLEDEIFNGEGGASCRGIIGEIATVSIAKEAGQGAATLEYENILKMWARAWGRGRTTAIWAYNQDVEPQLFAMSQGIGTAGVPVFLPPGGLSGSPYSTLFGRPLIPVEQAATLGTVGDISLCDFSQYALVRKGGLKTASSVHVRFIYDEMTFKFNMRINGKPKWKTALTPFKGSNTLSPFVTLATRA